MDWSMPGFPVLHHLLVLAQTHICWVGDTMEPSWPLSFPFSSCLQSLQTLGSFLMSQYLASWPKYWSFSFSISPSNEYSGLISFRIDRFDLLVVQGTFKRLLQHRILKASIFGHSVFVMVQLSHPYMTTGKTIALTIQTFVGKVMSLLFKMLSRFVMAFLPRSKHLLFRGYSHCLQWFWSPRNNVCHKVHSIKSTLSLLFAS